MAEHLKAQARLPLPNPADVIIALKARFDDYAEVTPLADGARMIHARFGRITLSAGKGELRMECVAPDASALSFGKMAAAEALAVIAPEAPAFVWEGDDAGTRALPFFREMQVVDAWAVTPLMRRVVLKGDAAHFAGPGLHVRVLIPPKDRAPIWPHADESGRMVMPGGEDTLVPRIYTVRAVDPARGEVSIDVALHEGAVTPGATWARGARAGDSVGLLGPGGGAPPPASWQLYLGDETALPVIARLLESLSAETRAVVRIEVANAYEEQPLPTAARLDLRWLHRGSVPAGTSPLLEDALGQVTFPENLATVCVFAGCEQATARRMRRYVLSRPGMTKKNASIAAYWRLGHDGVDVGD